MYALVENQTVVQYPYSLNQFRASYPNTSFPANITDVELSAYGVVRIILTGQPTYNQLTQSVRETTPAYSAQRSRWEQVWEIVEASAEEVEARKQAIKAQITADVQNRLDAFAQSRGYDNIVSACSYATSQHPKYGPEGRYCVNAREQTWDALFAIEAEVIAGTRPMPTGYDDIESELPPLVWPQ